MKMKNKFLFLSLLLITTLGFSQNTIVGKWKTFDDSTNEPKSIVEIYKVNNQYFGKVVEFFAKN